MSEVSLLLAFGFGILSFLAPCIFPLVPGILGYITGNAQSSSHTERIWKTSLFAAGFSSVFVASGALVGFFGFYLQADFPWIQKIAGATLVIFGLHLMGVVKIPLLYREVRVGAFDKLSFRLRLFAPVFVGMSFGLGWSPCMGPVLGGIFTLAYASETALYGMLLLAAYSIGLAVPFLVSAVIIERCTRLARRKKMNRLFPWIERVSGLVLIIVGALILADALVLLNRHLEFLNFFESV